MSTTTTKGHGKVWLDYRTKARHDLLRNLSAVAPAGDHLLTAADAGRTIECLTPDGDGFRLHRQIELDRLFPSLPGAAEGAEVDVESLSVSKGQLWICGSHCNVRKNAKDRRNLDQRIVGRPSRCLLGAVAL